ncbi:uncharacterized protein LOC142169069 [Nicotiana tabacum]|uniref:Uncharacterized protein LOC142169069 n=1 Tax=Nicotiana tabacum TaxID=4097 RepID=A0AC58SN39_TOBAC
MIHEQELYNLDDDDETEECDDASSLPPKSQKRERMQPMSSSCGSTGKTKGQYSLGMKPTTYHEVRGPYLKKEVAEVNKIVEEHKGSLFLESVDTSDSSTDSTKMYSLFKSTIDSIGAENIVQVITDNASENVKAGKTLQFNLNQAIRVHSYIVQRPLLLNMMKRFTKQRSLVKPAKTRFATTFLTLHRMYEQKSNLKKLFVSDEYTNSDYGREARGRESVNIILSPSFWNNVVHALKIGGPLVKVLHLVDGEQRPPMGYLYEAMDRAKEVIQVSFSDQRKYKRVFEIIDKRWDSKLHSSLHAVGLVLNPELFYDNEEIILGDEPLWNRYYEYSYQKRNKLTLKRLNDLVFIEYNTTLRRRYNARNIIDPIILDNIDDANEWLTGVPEDHADEEVFEETSDFIWGDVAEARGIGERIYGLRGSTSTSSSQRKGKEEATLSLVDKEEEAELI